MNKIKELIEKFKKFWNETLGPDYTDAELAELNVNSTNPTEVALAESSAEIDVKVNNYGEHRKAQRKKILEETRVTKEQLKTNSERNKNTAKEKVQTDRGLEREEK